MISYESQNALKAFEDNWVNVDWSGMTNTQKQVHIANHYGLKIAAAQEIAINTVEQEAQAEIDRQQRKELLITKLQSKGFYCDNSQHDWYLLYNRLTIFGDNWRAQADYQMNLSDGIDYFLRKVIELWNEYTV